MAKVVTRDFYNCNAKTKITVIPLGDIHIGAAACDEKLFQKVIQRIEQGENHYWICMGDVADYINMKDPRFSVSSLAKWIGMSELRDLAGNQRRRFSDFVRPIASKTLAMVTGNHEASILKHYERDIHLEAVSDIKVNGGFDADYNISVGYYGYLRLRFYASAKGEQKSASRVFMFNLHHGFTGGKLAGGKALNMQRWLWNHDCDVALQGHSHNTSIMKESVEYVDSAGRIRQKTKYGAFTGTFLNTVNDGGSSTYSEIKGYFPLPIGGVEIEVRPYDDQRPIKVSA